MLNVLRVDQKEVRIFAAWSGERHVVCSECLRAGPERIRERLVDKAVRLEAWAEDQRVLAERSWDLPTFKAWVAAIVADGDGEIERARETTHTRASPVRRPGSDRR